MDAASRPVLEPLSDVGPELSAPPPLASMHPAPTGRGLAQAWLRRLRTWIGTSSPATRSSSATSPGKLPIKGATDFERFCRENPELLDELGLPERVNAGVRLLEASGKPEPWQETPKRFWEKPQLVIGLGAAVAVLLVTLAVVASSSCDQIAARSPSCRKSSSEQPLEPASSTRTIRLLPSRSGGSDDPAVVIGGGAGAQLADLKIDMSRSAFRAFRVTIDRIDQGRVGIIHNLVKDSNGHLRIALNSSALGPGNYQLTIEGLTWRGETVPDAWVTIGITK